LKRFISLALFAVSLISSRLLDAQAFQNPYRIPTNGDPVGVFYADVNGDGIPDILYEDDSVGAVRILFGQPGGGTVAGPSLILPTTLVECRPLDANNDGKLDLVCLSLIDTFDVSIATYLGNGDGTFQAPIYSAQMQSNIAVNNGFLAWIFPPGKINGDAFPDLLVGDALDLWTFVLLGDGTGRFSVASIIQNIASDANYNDTVVDLNGDGKADLVTSSGPTIYLGNGDGTFKPPTVYGPYDSCVLHDMDADGHLDDVCGQFVNSGDIQTGATELAILHGNADGSFNTTPIATKVFGNPTGGYGLFLGPVAVFDVNGDGIPDILAFAADGLGVLLGQPGLTFSDPVHYADGVQASYGEQSSVFGDVNQDGVMDVIACGPNGLYITYGNKNGTFNTALAYPAAGVIGRMAVADFSGDGIPDIAATGDPNIELSIGNGDGTFKPFAAIPNGGIDFSTGGSAGNAQIVHGDFNGDGKQDLLAIGESGVYQYNSYILFGNGDGTFATPQLVPNTNVQLPTFDIMAVYDINQDGRDDIMTTDYSHIYFALSNGDGTFNTVTTNLPTYTGTIEPTFPALADFNGDGKLDAVFTFGASIYMFKGHGDGTFDSTGVVLPIPNYQSETLAYPLAVAAGDFDGDGHADFAVLVGFDAGIGPPWTSTIVTAALAYYGNGDGTFSAPVVAGAFDRGYVSIYSADLNKDGLADLVLQTSGSVGSVAFPSGDSLGVLMSQPYRIFGLEQDYNGGVFESGLAITDLNGDGYPDLLSANSAFSIDGDFNLQPGNSVTELLNLGVATNANALASSTTIVTSDKSITAGASVTFTATVASLKSGTDTPTGSVVFADQTGIHSSVALILASGSTAIATFTTSSLGIGTDVVSATYSGDQLYASSNAKTSETIAGYPATVTWTSMQNPAPVSEVVTFDIAVANPSGSSIATPVGFIQVSDDSGTPVGPLPLESGTDIYNLAFSTVGPHTLTVLYSGDALHSSKSASFTELVNETPAISITPSLPSVTIAQVLSVVITLGGGTGNPAPTGSVVLSGGGFTSSTTLSGGAATINIPAGALSLGIITLTGTYTPDAQSSSIYLSTSATTSVQVTVVPPGFTLTTTPITVIPGATTGNTSTITVTPAGGFTGNVTFSAMVTSSPNGAQYGPTFSFGSTNPVNISGTSAATATVTITTTAPTSASLVNPKHPAVRWYIASSASLAFALFFVVPIKRRAWRNVPGMLILLVMLSCGIAACGGGNNNGGSGGGGGMSSPGTTPGTYTITVTGTSPITGSLNPIEATSVVTLTVQ
jgi:hypothetical protein